MEDTSDTQVSGSFYLPFFVPYKHNFCVTQPWFLVLGTLALTTGSLRPEYISRHFHSSHLKPIFKQYKSNFYYVGHCPICSKMTISRGGRQVTVTLVI